MADHLGDPDVRLIESAFNREDYDSGHVPGALPWMWNEDFQHPIRKDIPDKEGWEALLARSGIANDTTVVVYGAPYNWYATYAFWLLTIYRHQDVRIMNGGREKWAAESRPLTTDAPVVAPTTYQGRNPDWTIRALRDRVQESIGNPSRVLVDVRGPDEYRGKLMPSWKLPDEGGQRGGHIPGAVNIPWSMALQDDGTFKPVEALQSCIPAKASPQIRKRSPIASSVDGRIRHGSF